MVSLKNMILQEYRCRRQCLLTKMASGSAALIFAAPKVIRTADSTYPYRQNSDFWYFTGFNESEALLILVKNNENHQYSILFNRMRDKITEIWTGRRLEQNIVADQLGIDLVLSWHELEVKLPLLIKHLDVIYHAQGQYDFADQLLFDTLNKLRCGLHRQLYAPTVLVDWRPWVHDMRLFKSEEELSLIRHACKITTLGHTRAMKKCQPGMYEYQLEGELQYEFNHHGARSLSYNTIVGSGANGCIIHYTKNESIMQSGDLVLIDAGCEYLGYASDVTRTFPVNGKFLPPQRAIYEIVLSMLHCSLDLCVPGRSIYEINAQVVRIMVIGLVKLGVMKGEVEELIAEQEYKQFFMHSLSHWLGLDVHDVGHYGASEYTRILEPGMVLTVEPGIYIAPDANIPASYRGIGIRIEDNIVITLDGNENFSSTLVKETNAIEVLMSVEY